MPYFVQRTGRLRGVEYTAGDEFDVSALPSREVQRLLDRGFIQWLDPALVEVVEGGAGGGGFTYRGAYALATVYAEGDVVSHRGAMYTCKVAHTSAALPTISDTFDRANGNPGPPWEANTAWAISSNRLKHNNGGEQLGGADLARFDLQTRGADVTATLDYFNVSDAFGLVFNCDPVAGTALALDIVANTGIRVAHIAAGVKTYLSDVLSATVTDNAAYRVTYDPETRLVTAYRGAVQVGTYTVSPEIAASLQGTHVGVYANNTSTYCDDFTAVPVGYSPDLTKFDQVTGQTASLEASVVLKQDAATAATDAELAALAATVATDAELAAAVLAKMTFRGIWSAATSYVPGDVVTRSGKVYHCRKAVSVTDPVTSAAGGAVPTVGSKITNGFNNGATPAWSAPTVAGSMLVVVHTCWGGSGDVNAPAGWVAAGAWRAGTSVQQRIYYKLNAPSETNLSGTFTYAGNDSLQAIEIRDPPSQPSIDYVAGLTDDDAEVLSGIAVLGHQGSSGPAGWTFQTTFVNNSLYGSISTKAVAAGETVTAPSGIHLLVVSGPGDNAWEALADAASPVDPGLAAVRGGVVGFATGADIVLPLPAGTVAGDMAVIFSFDRGTETAPGVVAGGTSLATDSGQGGARTQYKDLVAGDITAGSITAPTAGGAEVAIMVVVAGGNTAELVCHNRATFSTSAPPCAAQPQVNDKIVWLTVTRQDGTTPTRAASGRGLQVVSTGNVDFHAAGYIETIQKAGGIVNAASTSSSKNVVMLAGVAVR